MRKIVYAATAVFVGSLLALPIAVAAPYPEKLVRVIVPWPPGPTDILARLVSVELGARLKQSVIVDNRSGAGGIVGMQVTVQSPPDGYTLMITSADFGKFMVSEAAKWMKVVNEAGIQGE